MKQNMLKYKGYEGSVNIDQTNNILYGKIEFINALVNFEADNVEALKTAFHEAVDDYLEFCEEKGIQPEKPFKGSFNIRIGEERHRKTWVAARAQNISLNEYICQALDTNLEGSTVQPSYETNYNVSLSLPTSYTTAYTDTKHQKLEAKINEPKKRSKS